ncbi:MAG: hypothetical protein DRG66_06495 [Deltaproteobacteria bacterium]|jgi:hypothetical protein|nr:MAG: hypothetical protein DRG66_06495 [Deltaproteobacteria bacterium]
MVVQDEWALDPSVRMMRQVFGRIEVAQKELLERSNISPFDTRLRLWRETALGFFEQSWVQAAKCGIDLEEEKAATIYAHCLARAISMEGVEVAIEALPKDEKIKMLLKKTLS